MMAEYENGSWVDSTPDTSYAEEYRADMAGWERRLADPRRTLKRMWDCIEIEPISRLDKAHSLREIAMALIAVVLEKDEN